MPATRKWTFMVYNNYDDPMISWMHGDILDQLMEVGSTDEVSLVALCDAPPPLTGASTGAGTPLFHIPRKDQPQVLTPHDDWPVVELDMGHPATLVRFAGFAKRCYPAENYALVMACHGSGWTTGKASWRSDARTDRLVRLLDTRRSGRARRPGPMNRIVHGAGSPRGSSLGTWRASALSPDMTSQSEMSTINLGLAAESIATALGQPLDLLAFDACNMQMAEIAFQLAGSVHYQVGPEWFGRTWSYRDLCGWLTTTPDLDARDLALAMVESYRAHQQSLWTPRFTLSASDLTQTELLGHRLDELVDAVLACPVALAKLHEVVRATQLLNELFQYRDLGDFVTRLLGHPVSNPARQAGGALLQQLDRTIIAHCVQSPPTPTGQKVSTESFLDKTTGLSISLPLFCKPGEPNTQAYLALDIAQKTRWPDFLRHPQGPKP